MVGTPDRQKLLEELWPDIVSAFFKNVCHVADP
jgi:hypothetical protein